MTNPLFLSADPDTKKLRESHVPARLTDAMLSAKIAAAVGTVTPDGAVTSTDFTHIKLSHDPTEEAPAGTVIFYLPPPVTLFTTFSGLPVGETPSGWTPRWATSRMWKVVEDPTASGGVALECASASGTSGLQWDAVSTILGSGTDGELVWKWRTGNLVVPARGFMAGSGDATSPTMFHGAMRNISVASLGKFVDGEHTVTIGNQKTLPGLEAATWYISRMRKTGSLLQARTWRADEIEPVEWQMEATDDAISGTGWWGLLSHVAAGANATHTYDWVGFALGDRTAPRGD